MTLVVAVEDRVRGQVILGGDAFCGSDDINERCAAPKVYIIGNLGVGVSGRIRYELALDKVLREYYDKQGDFSEEWLLRRLPALFRAEVGEEVSVAASEEVAFEYILALDGKLYYLEDSYAVWRPGRPYAAIGVAKKIALGALALAFKRGVKNKTLLVRDVLTVGASLSTSVSAPFTVVAV